MLRRPRGGTTLQPCSPGLPPVVCLLNCTVQAFQNLENGGSSHSGAPVDDHRQTAGQMHSTAHAMGAAPPPAASPKASFSSGVRSYRIMLSCGSCSRLPVTGPPPAGPTRLQSSGSVSSSVQGRSRAAKARRLERNSSHSAASSPTPAPAAGVEPSWVASCGRGGSGTGGQGEA